ncbi:hypothetical protein HPP92_018499, partial [Vanilla planifolia]
LDDLSEYLAVSSTDESDEDDNGDMIENLEDLSKRILEKKDKKVETVWEQLLRRQIEKEKSKEKRGPRVQRMLVNN